MKSFVAFVMAALLVMPGCKSSDKVALEARRSTVAEKGANVMPFDLETTTHVFDKKPFGGVQQVVADDGNTEQVRLIRQHLQEEAVRFAKGDFHDPAMIHGHDMPGMHQLVMGYEKLSIEYSEIENGGQIVYSTADPELVEAVHAWFDAQLSDHGRHAAGQ
jgi:hypothetical protein